MEGDRCKHWALVWEIKMNGFPHKISSKTDQLKYNKLQRLGLPSWIIKHRQRIVCINLEIYFVSGRERRLRNSGSRSIGAARSPREDGRPSDVALR